MKAKALALFLLILTTALGCVYDHPYRHQDDRRYGHQGYYGRYPYDRGETDYGRDRYRHHPYDTPERHYGHDEFYREPFEGSH